MEPMKTFYSADRQRWRDWLAGHFETEEEIWFVFPMKASGETGLSYNDAVEEALCFGWIDSTIKNLDPLHRAQRFTPRKAGSAYSRPNIERLIRLEEQGLLNPNQPTAPADVLVIPMSEDFVKAVEVATALRDAGIRTQLYTEKKKFKAKIGYADKLGIPYVVFLGEDEIANNVITLKDMASGQQQTLPAAQAVALLKEGLARKNAGTVILEK